MRFRYETGNTGVRVAGVVVIVFVALTNQTAPAAVCSLSAWPTNVAGEINACIAALPTGGGEVTLPAGKYKITSTIQMGDGTDSTPSTRFGVSLIGAADGFSSQESSATGAQDSGTVLVADSLSGPMLKINGPTGNMRIEGIHFQGGGVASGIEIIHGARTFIERVSVSNYVGIAYKLTSRPVGSSSPYGNCSITMTHFNALSPATSSSSGMLLDGYYQSGSPKNTCGVVATSGALWYGGGTNSSGLELAFTDSNQFKRILMSCALNGPACLYSGGYGLKFSQPSHSPSFPYGNAFDNVYYTQGVTGTSGTAGNWFVNLPASEGVAIPWGITNVRGITDKGELFGQVIATNSGSSNTVPSMYIGERNGAHNGAGGIVFKREQSGFQERARVRSDYFDGLVFGTASGEVTIADRWRIAPGGDLLPFSDNTYDLGSSATRVKNIYLTGSVSVNGSTGLSRTVNVGSCNITFTGGVATSSTCP